MKFEKTVDVGLLRRMSRELARSCCRAALGFAAALGLATSASAQHPNDLCVDAQSVMLDELVTGDPVGATHDPLVDACTNFGYYDIWYEFTAPYDGTYRFQTGWAPGDGTKLAHSLAIYSSCGGPLLACDNNGSIGRIDLPMTAGQSVRARVANAGYTDFERITFTVLFAPWGPVNDDCEFPTPLPLGYSYLEAAFDVQEAHPSSTAFSCDNCTGNDLWYTLTAPVDGSYRVVVNPFIGLPGAQCYGAGVSVGIAVYTDCSLTQELACDVVPFPSTGQENGLADVTFSLTSGQSVLLRVSMCRDYFQSWDIYADFAPTPPPNDLCANASPIYPSSSTQGSTTGADGLYLLGTSCVSSAVFDVWHTFTNPYNNTAIFTFQATSPTSDFEPMIMAYDSCYGNILGCEPFLSGAPPSSTLFLVLDAHQTVLLRIAGDGIDGGTNCHRPKYGLYELSVDAGTFPFSNDDCAHPDVLVPGSSVGGTTLNATASTGLTTCYADPNIASYDVWYSLTNTETFKAYFDVDNYSTNPLVAQSIAVYNSCSGSPIKCAAPGYYSNLVRLKVILDPGQTALLRVACIYPDRSDFQLNVSYAQPTPPVPANDLCPDAQPLDNFPFDAFPFRGEINTELGAPTPDLDVSCNEPAQTQTAAGIWYELTPAFDVILSFQSDYSLSLVCAVFANGCDSLTPVACLGNGADSAPLNAGTTYRILVGQYNNIGYQYSTILGFSLDLKSAIVPGEICSSAVAVSAPAHGVLNLSSLVADGLADAGIGSPCLNNPAGFPNGLLQSGYVEFTAPARGRLAVHLASQIVGYVGASYRQVAPSNDCSTMRQVACTFPGGYDMFATLNAGQSCIIQVGTTEPSSNALVDFDLAFSLLCPGDFNDDASVTVSDIFAFLNAWFSQFNSCSGPDCSADLNGNNAVEVADIFAFLNQWFSQFGRPCP